MIQPNSDQAAVDLVRRRLLITGGKYVAPAIIVSLMLDQNAYGQASCQPNNCPPVSNNCGPIRSCRPGRGG